MTAVTAVTVQNTVEVRAIHQVPPETIVAQVAAVADDIGVDAVKIGMLGTAETIAAVDTALDLIGGAPVVLDPVMVAESGAVLLDDGAREALVELLVPRATVVTPNLPEARVLAGVEHRGGDQEQLARAVHELGPDAVVVTGGHAEGGEDVFLYAGDVVRIGGARHPDGASHGSGCTHSSTLAAWLAHGYAPLEAAEAAREAASRAVRDGLRSLGAGAGPVDVLGVAGRAPVLADGPWPSAGQSAETRLT